MGSKHCGYIIEVKELRPHNNADRLQILGVFGTETCVPLDVKVGDIGVYFPTDLQLSEEFCAANDLVERKDENGEKAGGYLHPSKRNVKCIKLRGEKSDGMYLPISCFDYLNLAKPLKPGDVIDELEGHEICRKYIPAVRAKAGHSGGVKTGRRKTPIAPLFAEHVDTEQLPYNLDAFKAGDYVEITLKMHGTSGRTGHLPKHVGYNDSFGTKTANAIKNILNKLIKTHYEEKHDEPIYEWGYVSGTRRVVIEDFDKPAYYDSNDFREEHAKAFEGKLYKGETAYYEIVGFQNNGVPIMASCDNKKTKDKDFIKQYGPTTEFSYGCSPSGWTEDSVRGEMCPVSDMYVYRMTMTNEDGDVVEYTPDFMRYRCEQMGIKTVPVLWSGIIPDFYQLPDNVGSLQEVNAGEFIKNIAEQYYEGADPIGKTHIREGIVARIVNRPGFKAYKYKNFYFKVLENIIKVDAEAPDMEEAQEELAGEI